MVKTRRHRIAKKQAEIERVHVNLPDGTSAKVPVNSDGYVPQDWLVRQSYLVGHAYNDYNAEATKQYPAKVTPRQAAVWLNDIDNVDIDNIDVKGTPQKNIGSRTGKKKEIHQKIRVFGTPTEEKKVRGLIDESFSTDDLEKITDKGSIEVVCRPEPLGSLGHTDRNSYVAYDRRKGMKNGVIVHEIVHCLRKLDRSRKGIAASAIDNPKLEKLSDKEQHNVEESCTVAESAARSKGTYQGSGYYWDVPVKDAKTGRLRSPTSKEALKMAAEDRKLFTNNTNRPLSGDAAIKSVEENWAKSHISRLRTGRTMAINSMAKVDEKYKVEKPKPKTSKKPAVKKTAAKKPTSKNNVAKKPTKTKQTTFYERCKRTVKPNSPRRK